MSALKNIYCRQIEKSFITIETLFTDPILETIIDHQDKLDTLVCLLQCAFILPSDLDTYVTNTWIDETEKAAILDEANLL